MRKRYRVHIALDLLPCNHHRLFQLDDDKSSASCQQAWCKSIAKTFYSQAWYKFFQQLEASLQISSEIKSDFNRRDTTW